MINNNNTITIFEYIMYITLSNYLNENLSCKFVVNIMT